MGRTPCCEKVGLKKGPWTTEEDHKLVSYIEQHGHGSWRALPSKAGLQRCGKSCRLRWTNYLRPDIKRGKFNVQEEQTIIQLHALLGNRWSAIATHLPKRTDNEIKNYWNTHIKKRLTKMGIDPITHRRRVSAFGIGPSKNAANLSHMAQWENARLEAEARLVRDAKLVSATGPNMISLHNSSTHLVDKSTLSRPIRPQPLCLDVLKAWQGIMSSKISNRIPLESPTSTLNFPDITTTVPNIGLFDNYVEGMRDQGVIMEQDIQNDSKILESNVFPQMNKEKMENSTELDEMVYPNYNAFPVTMEGFTELIDVATMQNLTENNNIDLEENWINILNNLANSSCSSIF